MIPQRKVKSSQGLRVRTLINFWNAKRAGRIVVVSQPRPISTVSMNVSIPFPLAQEDQNRDQETTSSLDCRGVGQDSSQRVL